MESGYRIDNIILVDSNFHRVNDVNFGEEVKNNLDIHTNVSVNGNQIIVDETVTVSQKYGDDEQVNISVRMVGLFAKIGESPITNLEEFGKVNGAAIIYPFIREIISNTSIKAGLPAIILPPVNFTSQTQKEEEKNLSNENSL
ncbi:MAG: protein-export chaperone SecB [Bacteroidales bacterium]|nr:protein-export chaperone SecB [Bacteroidales bacterium]